MARTWFFTSSNRTEDRETTLIRLAAQAADQRAERQALLRSAAMERPTLRFSI